MSPEKNVDKVLSENNDKEESIQELAHRHLVDINHHTTDEEIKNAHVTFSQTNDYLEEEIEKTEEKSE